jgi:hypothetical protein
MLRIISSMSLPTKEFDHMQVVQDVPMLASNNDIFDLLTKPFESLVDIDHEPQIVRIVD